MIRKIFIFSLFLTISCTNLGSLKNNFGQETISLPDKQQERFLSYIKGNYFSYEFNREENLKAPIAFAITKDGNKSLIIMCNEQFIKCQNGIYILQTISQYSKKINEKLYIFALENKIVWNGINQYIGNKSRFETFLNSNKIIQKNTASEITKIKFYDKIFDPSEADGCNADEC